MPRLVQRQFLAATIAAAGLAASVVSPAGAGVKCVVLPNGKPSCVDDMKPIPVASPTGEIQIATTSGDKDPDKDNKGKGRGKPASP